MYVDDGAFNPGMGEAIEHVIDQRAAGDRHQRLGPVVGQRFHPRAEAGASVFCHRDYHAENLIWLPDREGAERVGLLDFQDALKAHPVWDLSMLLHDARRDVSAEREAACLDRYFQLRPEVDRAEMEHAYHWLGALNIVRILGIFARLVTRDGKPRYAAMMPRLWGYLDRCLADPDLAPLKAWLEAHVPPDART
jgi:aminoglycoside/choline kinase family phosphotransferase